MKLGKSITDPDARLMKANNNGTDIAHNIQIAVDSKNHLVAAIDVTSSHFLPFPTTHL